MDRFYKKYKKLEDGYLITTITKELSDILSSKTRDVILSQESLNKNLSHHPELSEEDYILLSEIVGRSNLVAKDGDKTIAVVLKFDKLYHYVLKSTKSGETIFLTSFRYTRASKIKSLRKKDRQGRVKIIKDNLP